MGTSYEMYIANNWWQKVRTNLDAVTQVIVRDIERVDYSQVASITATLRQAYNNIKQVRCPDEADEIFTNLTRAILYLRMAYEEYYSGREDRAQRNLEDARYHTIQLQVNLVQNAIIENFGAVASF